MKHPKSGNTAAILETIWMNEGISRIDLAKRLEIDKSTVSNVVSDLLARRLVDEYDQANASSLGGRKPVKLRLHPHFGVVLGIELQPDFYRVMAVDLVGNPVFRHAEALSTDGTHVEERILSILELLKSRDPRLVDRCLGLGLALSGVVDPVRGILLESTSLAVHNLSLGTSLGVRLPFPCHLENDANAACWGEMIRQRRSAQPAKNFVFCLMVAHDRAPVPMPQGLSIGLGFVLDGEIHYGEDFSAGEFRSVEWQPGNTFQFGLNDDEMARLAQDEGLQDRLSRELVRHLFFLSRTFSIHEICFGGADRLGPSLLRVLAQEQARQGVGGTPPRFRFSEEGADAVAFGAALIGLIRFFRDAPV